MTSHTGQLFNDITHRTTLQWHHTHNLQWCHTHTHNAAVTHPQNSSMTSHTGQLFSDITYMTTLQWYTHDNSSVTSHRTTLQWHHTHTHGTHHSCIQCTVCWLSGVEMMHHFTDLVTGVCVCDSVWVCVCMCVWVHACVHACVSACVCLCTLAILTSEQTNLIKNICKRWQNSSQQTGTLAGHSSVTIWQTAITQV